MRHTVINLAAALLLVSCTAAQTIPGPARGSAGVRFQVGIGTRSSIAASEESIGNLTLLFYEDGVLVPELNVSLDGLSGTDHEVEVTMGVGRSYKVAAFANCTISPVPQTLDELQSLCYSCNGISTWSDGLPMACTKTITVTYPAEPVTLELQRLAARLNLSVNTSGLQHGSIVFNSVTVRQMNCVCPFFASGAATAGGGVCDGDIASASDIQRLNNSTGGDWSIPFYLLENMQGDILSGNTDPDKKIPQSITAAGADPSLCTYLEIVGVYTDRSGYLKGEPFTTRLYLGRDASSNFDIVRNCRYSISLKMSDKGCLRSDWKVESNLEDRRRLKFAQTSVSVQAPAQLSVTLNTNLSLEAGDYSYRLSGDVAFFNFTPGSAGFTITPKSNMTGRKTVTVTATTWDGAISTSCKVKGMPDPSNLIEITWGGELYVGQKKALTLRDPTGRSLAGRVLILPTNPCLTADGDGANWTLSGHFAGYDAPDLMLDGEVITHLDVAVLSPRLAFPSQSIILPMDGSPVEVGPFFYKNDGTRLYYEDFDPELYSSALSFTLTRYCMGSYAGSYWPRSNTAGNVAVEVSDEANGYPSYVCRLMKLTDRGRSIGENYDLSGGAVAIERLTATIDNSLTGSGSDTAELCVQDPFASSRSLGSASSYSGSSQDRTVTLTSSSELILDGSNPANASGAATTSPEHYSISFPSSNKVGITILYGTYGSAAQPPSQFSFTPVMTNVPSGATYQSLYTYSVRFN